jgi:hypothetical protein
MENIQIIRSDETTLVKKPNTEGNKRRVTAAAEILIGRYQLFVFPGAISEHDILMKYNGPYNPDPHYKRTPKHLHWLIDLLLKKQGNPDIANVFLKRCKSFWETEALPLEDNDYDHVKRLVDSYLNSQDYFGIEANSGELNKYGEFPMTFVAALFVLLATEEKTNMKDAYMFGQIIDELLKPSNELDISKVVSTAAFRGKIM